MLNKQENLVFICRQNQDIIGTMKAQWNKSETWNVDTHTFFFKKDRKDKVKDAVVPLDMYNLFFTSGKAKKLAS